MDPVRIAASCIEFPQSSIVYTPIYTLGVHDTALPPGKTIEGLEQESAAIEGKFAKLVASIYKSLTARSVSKDSLVSCLAGFKSRTKVFDADNPTVFRNEKSKFEDPSATLNTVWNVVADYFSFFDYEVLETIIIALGTDSDNKSIVKYKEDFEEYAKQRLIVLQKDTTVQNGEGRIEHSMIVKLDSSYDGCAIRSLKTLETKLSDILGLEKGVLKLRKVTDGCVQLVFTILDFIPCIIFPLSLDQESALGGLGVKQLDCEGYHFRANVCCMYLIYVHVIYHGKPYLILRKMMLDPEVTTLIMVRIQIK